jgi:hypothetical protein
MGLLRTAPKLTAAPKIAYPLGTRAGKIKRLEHKTTTRRLSTAEGHLIPTVGLITGREDVFLRHLWGSFTGDKQAAPFENWKPYIEAMERSGVARAGASYYRSAYRSADEVRALDVRKLDIPVLSIAGEKGIGALQQQRRA